MPQCFQLLRKTDGVAESLVKIDEDLCKLLGKETHPNLYVNAWFDEFGFRFAMGETIPDVLKKCQESKESAGLLSPMLDDALKILEHLNEHYTAHAFYQSK